MDMRKLVGENLHKIRKQRGLTQERLADLSGFPQHYISEVERGKRNPSIITIYEIATALGVSHVELVKPPRKKTKR